MMAGPEDEVYKIALCGKMGVGKTSIYTRLSTDEFPEEEQSLHHIDQCFIPLVCICNKKLKIHLWDTLGMEEYESLTRNHYSNSKVVLVVYSLDLPDSLAQVKECTQSAQVNAPAAKIVLVANKMDLPNYRRLETDLRVKEMFPKTEYEHQFRISAKTGEGLNELKCFICKCLHKLSRHDSSRSNHNVNSDMQNISLSGTCVQRHHRQCCVRH